MKPLLVVLIIFVPIGLCASCTSGQAKDEAFFCTLGESSRTTRSGTVGCILAPERRLGYIRGLNTVLDPIRKVLARMRCTEIFVYRDGRWLAVAGEESPISDTK